MKTVTFTIFPSIFFGLLRITFSQYLYNEMYVDVRSVSYFAEFFRVHSTYLTDSTWFHISLITRMLSHMLHPLSICQNWYILPMFTDSRLRLCSPGKWGGGIRDFRHDMVGKWPYVWWLEGHSRLADSGKHDLGCGNFMICQDSGQDNLGDCNTLSYMINSGLWTKPSSGLRRLDTRLWTQFWVMNSEFWAVDSKLFPGLWTKHWALDSALSSGLWTLGSGLWDHFWVLGSKLGTKLWNQFWALGSGFCSGLWVLE